MISNTISANKKHSQRFDRIFAENVADEIVTRLQNHFVRYQICGSLRRMKETVGDIDIVAIPRLAYEPPRTIAGLYQSRKDLVSAK